MRKDWLLSGVLVLSAPLVSACGVVCGDGITDLGEECDDTNTAAGDGCSDVCVFEAPKTDYRISELTLNDDTGLNRFSQSNLLIGQAITATDTTKALTVLAKFGGTEIADGASTIIFGAGTFNTADGSFDFVTDLGGTPVDLTPIDITIANGATSFTLAQFVLPIETEAGSGIFVGLPIQNVAVSASLEKIQKGDGGLFFDQISDTSTITAEVKVFDLCATNLNAFGITANLLDTFDDGVPDSKSALFPPAGTAPDTTNCVPCGGPQPSGTCVSPEDGPDGTPGTGDEFYIVSANFEAQNESPDQAFNNQSLIINAP